MDILSTVAEKIADSIVIGSDKWVEMSRKEEAEVWSAALHHEGRKSFSIFS